jgi:hypothetical protein
VERAQRQGYSGARWPKCIGPEGREWPNEIHALLAWQQPHPLFLAELEWRADPSPKTLVRWNQVVEASADFMASSVCYDENSEHYNLGPPMHLVSENSDPYSTINPCFELAYWRYGLEVAQRWRERQGLARRADWDAVIAGLAPLPQQEGLYVLHEGVKDMWGRFAYEHPALLGAYGLLPGPGVDRGVMQRTYEQVQQSWDFNRCWGWDFPLMALSAARLGRCGDAVDLLLQDRPTYNFDERGLAAGGPFPYFPTNASLLYAAAFMAAGWDGAPQRNAPGFPDDGSWTVECEGLAVTP